MSSEALALLARLKLRGALRRQWRRVRTLRGAVFTLVGGFVFSLWMISPLQRFVHGGEGADPETFPQKVGLVALCLVLLSLSSALSHRGLFLPKDEIERLFAAPLSRADLVRYRLRVAHFRNSIGALILGGVAMVRAPEPLFGFLGAFLGLITLSTVNQLLAILLGSLEARLAKRLAGLGRVLWPAAFVLFVVMLVGSTLGDDLGRRLGELFSSGIGQGAPLHHPVVVALTLPFLPWAEAIAATDLESFTLWIAVCLGLHVLLHEVTARVPIDFRELSLETAESVAARIRRVRRGGGAAAAPVTRRAAGRGVPWLFGRGPGGAIAWRKTGAILRKARSTFYISAFLLGIVTLLTTIAFENTEVWQGSLMIAGFGTVYLCAGLRFDFRDELDRMEVIKAWPVAPARVFLAIVLPEVALVSLLLIAATLTRALVMDGMSVITLGIACSVPFVVLAWVALDNAVFLFAPVRFVPGQEGALQNAGRGMVLVILRLFLILVVGTLAALGFIGARVTTGALGGGEGLAMAAGFGALLVVLASLDAGLIGLGGLLFRRFDLARDRG